eukprot:1668605-Pleurochrysis_carterae.AAC.1
MFCPARSLATTAMGGEAILPRPHSAGVITTASKLATLNGASDGRLCSQSRMTRDSMSLELFAL